MYIHDVNVGIIIGTGRQISSDSVWVTRNRIVNARGSKPGWGYGIQNINAGPAWITDNTIVHADRHSIYQARGRGGAFIERNLIIDHGRYAVDQHWPKAALVVARSSNVVVAHNTILDSY